ncbi:MAG: hypothetical protein M3O70_12255 [Actinomycetota bacterium]|nr:hypothetical protein [Actinomycetota bacterium]
MGNRVTSALRTHRKKIAAVVVGVPVAVALAGGSAVAASKIGTNDIQNGAVTKPKLAKDSAGTWEVMDRTLGGWDLRKDSVGRHVLTPHLRDMIEQWESGSFEGEQGPQGPAGEDGKDGVSRYEVVGRGTDSVTLEAKETAVITTLCPSENSSPEQQAEVALGGGSKVTSGSATLHSSYPHQVEQVSEPDEADPAGRWGAKGWAVEVTAGPYGATVQPYVVCAAMN